MGSFKQVATRLGLEAYDYGPANGTTAFGGDADHDSSDSAEEHDGAIIDASLRQVGCEPRVGGRYEEDERDMENEAGHLETPRAGDAPQSGRSTGNAQWAFMKGAMRERPR